MKKISRMLIFSGVALYITSIWNAGFQVDYHIQTFVKAVVMIAVFYYIVAPLTKIILLPVNLLTLGLISTLVYFVLIYLFFTRFSIAKITAWDFPGAHLSGVVLPKIHFSSLQNNLLSAFSLSAIIRLLEFFL